MKKLFYVFSFFAITVNAQIINIKIVDLLDDSPMDKADVYFKNSTVNFVSDREGRVVVDLNSIHPTDELIVSKKDYQNAILKVSDLNYKDLAIQLEKVPEIELSEAFITNLRVGDILAKVIENYADNFNTEKHYYKVNFVLDAVIDSVDRDLLDVDLQFRFKKDHVKINSNNTVNHRLKGQGLHLESNYRMMHFFRNSSLLEIIQNMQNKLSAKLYEEERVLISKYANKYMYDVEFKNAKTQVTNYFLIDKETFAIVEHRTTQENKYFPSTDETINYHEVIYKYRPYQNKWILKESSTAWNTSYVDKNKEKHALNVLINMVVNDFSYQPFPDFNQSVNEKMDIRKFFN